MPTISYIPMYVIFSLCILYLFFSQKKYIWREWKSYKLGKLMRATGKRMFCAIFHHRTQSIIRDCCVAASATSWRPWSSFSRSLSAGASSLSVALRLWRGTDVELFSDIASCGNLRYTKKSRHKSSDATRLCLGDASFWADFENIDQTLGRALKPWTECVRLMWRQQMAVRIGAWGFWGLVGKWVLINPIVIFYSNNIV